MQFSLSTLSLALATLVATAQGCLILDGVINQDGTAVISLVDNGKGVCSFYGRITGGEQYMSCLGGFASWVRLVPVSGGSGVPGSGLLAYANGPNNHRVQVSSYKKQDSATTFHYEIEARAYC